ncbi:Pentatricopeptide repeat-containing protein MRL1, chloroplastic [Vitis vinifera]|uniref:Pentatricopeptide repeat-containing protein MRL1, chloroplastic n=1 Tax=Vitis vinifera TaxID=29760 RepID=A0A438DMJ0_VITVI|nr:Pentatricopeptide repeat-containing protein MRL1, chloroplastic [Vitis vinifera]
MSSSTTGEGEQLEKAMEVLSDMKRVGLCPNTITYSILLVASEKKDDIDVGLMILSQARKDSVALILLCADAWLVSSIGFAFQ